MAIYKIDNVNAPIDFQERNQIKRALQNAKNLLMCRMGEVPYDRYRGFDFGLYGLPITMLDEELVPELDRVMMWEPDVDIVSAETSLLPNGETYISVTVDVGITETVGGD